MIVAERAPSRLRSVQALARSWREGEPCRRIGRGLDKLDRSLTEAVEALTLRRAGTAVGERTATAAATTKRTGQFLLLLVLMSQRRRSSDGRQLLLMMIVLLVLLLVVVVVVVLLLL